MILRAVGSIKRGPRGRMQYGHTVYGDGRFKFIPAKFLEMSRRHTGTPRPWLMMVFRWPGKMRRVTPRKVLVRWQQFCFAMRRSMWCT